MHSRKSLLFDNMEPWVKRENKHMFDVTMGSYDGAEVCELVGLYILNILGQKYDKEQIGLYRDDGLGAFKNISGGEAERIKKGITKVFSDLGLKITIETNLRVVNFLDITLNLSDGKYYPYRKPNDRPVYVHKQSNHPPSIINHIPAAIAKRISTISSDKEVFDRAAPYYNNALRSSGYNQPLQYTNLQQTTKRKRNRQRNITWFNPPFSKSVQTNIGKTFLRLLEKHFPKESKLSQIFNKNSVKISYSCMENVATIIKSHNKNIAEHRVETPKVECNCRDKSKCPLQGSCRSKAIVYTAKVATEDGINRSYIGLTDNAFKTRYANHLQSFSNKSYENSTELSKFIWRIKHINKAFNISWSILSRASAYSNASKRCNLCLTEKLRIINADKSTLLNKRSELVSKCRHENKYRLSNYWAPLPP